MRLPTFYELFLSRTGVYFYKHLKLAVRFDNALLFTVPVIGYDAAVGVPVTEKIRCTVLFLCPLHYNALTGILHELCWHDRGHFRFLRAHLNTPPFAYVLYAAVHWRTVYGSYVEYAAVAVNSPYDAFRTESAIGTEDAYVQAVWMKQFESPWQRVSLMELDGVLPYCFWCTQWCSLLRWRQGNSRKLACTNMSHRLFPSWRKHGRNQRAKVRTNENATMV